MPDRRPGVAWLALAGIAAPAWLLGASLALGAMVPGYEPLRDAISELGERGAPTALIWNTGGFGAVALLYLLHAVAVRAGLGSGWLYRLVLLQAILIAAGGAFSCDPGCPAFPRSASMVGHTVAGLTYFATTTILPLVAWRTFRRRDEWRALARPSLAVGIVLVALFFVGPALGAERVGAWQRTVLLLAGTWSAVVALRLHGLLRRSSPTPDRLASPEPERSGHVA